MSNSPLISHTNISDNKTNPRKSKIDTITIHCFIGQFSVERMCEMFKPSKKKASANYVIGSDGRIGLCVDEADRSWCSSNATNDHRAITIECASDLKAPYAINNKVMNSLIDLLVDICKRNNIKELKWKADKSLIGKVDKQNVTVHRWFAAKSCPGDYIYNRLGDICEVVNSKLKHPLQTDVSFLVHVDISNLKIRKGPGTNYKFTGKYTGKGSFTITEFSGGVGSVKGWGKLKSGAGWISLDYATRA